MSTLFFYTKEQFFNFKASQSAAGFEFLSMSQLLSSSKIDGLDECRHYYVDISSMMGFAKSNDSQLLNFEQLFCSFGENITFICDKVYEKDIKYLFRYVFDDFSDVEAERINIPAVARHHWRYRMHVTIEQLMANEGFNSKLRTLIDNSGRG